MISVYWPALVCALSASVLLFAEVTHRPTLGWVAKPLAALAFILQAVVAGALESTYGMLVFAALILSAIGDVCLLPRERPSVFKAGVLAFGLAHLVYAAAFVFSGAPGPIGWLSIAVAGAVALGSGRWLLPRVDQPDRSAIGAYIGIISVMLAAALAKAGGSLPWCVGIAAVMFAISDMFVARDRFVTASPGNSLLITPLYFGAQILFALSVL